MNDEVDKIFIALEVCGGRGTHGSRMLGVPEHAFRLSEAISVVAPSPAADWLRLAAGVLSVNIDLQAYDHTTMMCGSAFEYYDAHSNVAEMMSCELTRFMYLWGGLESFVHVPANRPKTPVIRKLLDEYETKFSALAHFRCQSSHLKTCLLPRSEAFSECSTFPNDYDAKTSAVFAFVAKLRNALVHGAVAQASAPKWGGKPADELSVVACAQRLALMTLQMLILLRYPDHEMYTHDLEGNTVDAPVKEVIPEIHLVPIRYDWAL